MIAKRPVCLRPSLKAYCVCAAFLGLILAGCAPGNNNGPSTLANYTPAAATMLAQDVEQGLELAQVGNVLYRADQTKRRGYDYCSMSHALADQGEFRASVEAALKALFLGVRDGDHVLNGYAARDLGYAYKLAGDNDHAETWAKEALRQARFAGYSADDEAAVIGPAHQTLGDVALQRGKIAQAMAEYKLALGQSRPNFKPVVRAALANALARSGDLAGAEAALELARREAPQFRAFHDRLAGEIALRAGDTAKAIERFNAVVQGSSGDDAPYHRMWALIGRARAERARGDVRAARASYALAFTVAETVRARFRSEEFKAGLFGDLQHAFDESVDLAWDDNDPVGALALAEQGRARAFLDLVGERISGQSARVAQVAPIAVVQAALPASTALIVYYVTEHATRAWVIRRDSVKPVSLGAGIAELTPQVVAFRDQIDKRGDTPAARTLYARLVAPLGLRAAEDVIIVPHRVLHQLPFQALEDGRQRLIEQRAVSYAPTASSVIASNQADTGPIGSLLVLADPNLGVPAYDLPGAEREGRRVSAIVGHNAELLLRGDATAAALVRDAPTHQVLHIASHAMVDDIDPLASRILLSSTPTDTGEFEARRFYQMDLTHTRLVVLSSCESGVGALRRGDELYGFQRTVLASGASALIASLWAVSDDSTAMLMEAFYTRLAAGDSTRAAMRAAMRAVMADPHFRSPYFWAPFDLVGRWE